MYEFIPSPNFKVGRRRDIDMVVLHWTASGTMSSAVNWFKTKYYEDQNGKRRRNKASSHYVIDHRGHIVQMVLEKDTAWHAGLSEYEGKKYCNSRSVGIELVNWGPLTLKDGHYYAWTGKKTNISNPHVGKDGIFRDRFSLLQTEACARLCRELTQRYPNIKRKRIVGHEFISGKSVRPDPKQDPGPAFDWRLFDQHFYVEPKRINAVEELHPEATVIYRAMERRDSKRSDRQTIMDFIKDLFN